MARGNRRSYTPEYKDQLVRAVIEDSRAIAEVARENGVTETSLGNWVKKYREEHPVEEEPLSVSERARLREAEKELREVRMENEFLKKAAAFFAREHR